MKTKTKYVTFILISILAAYVAIKLEHVLNGNAKPIEQPKPVKAVTVLPSTPNKVEKFEYHNLQINSSPQLITEIDYQLTQLTDVQLRNVYLLAQEGIAIGTFSQEQNTIIPRGRSLVTVEPYATPQPNPTGKKLWEIEYFYGFDKIASQGEGMTIAIVVPAGSPTLVNDLKVFSAAMNIPDASVSFIYPQGVPTTYNDSWALETTLDAQWAHALAPKAKLLMVITNSSTISGLLQGIDAAVAAGAKIVSTSWGSVEWASQLSGKYIDTWKAKGVTFVCASGDSGLGATYPSIHPSVIAVGGTTCTTDAKGIVTETSWNRGAGGQSRFYPKPSWQAKVNSSAFRQAPDLSFHATGYSVYISSGYQKKRPGWYNVSGTSASAPCVAGLVARGYALKKTPVIGLHPQLYTNSSLFFKDITAGTQLNGGKVLAGYDMSSGLGSPQAVPFVTELTK
jgi:subtilase family serine protease